MIESAFGVVRYTWEAPCLVFQGHPKTFCAASPTYRQYDILSRIARENIPDLHNQDAGILVWLSSWFLSFGFMVFNEHSVAIIQPVFKGVIGDIVERGKRIVAVLNYLKDTVMVQHGQPDNGCPAGVGGF
jgi:hypothetical protein